MPVVCWCGRSSRPRVFTDWCSTLFEMLKPCSIAYDSCIPPRKLASAINKRFTEFEAAFHTHALFLKLFHSWIHRTCDTPAHFWGCSLINTAYSGMRETAVSLTVAICVSPAKFGLFWTPLEFCPSSAYCNGVTFNSITKEKSYRKNEEVSGRKAHTNTRIIEKFQLSFTVFCVPFVWRSLFFFQ